MFTVYDLSRPKSWGKTKIVTLEYNEVMNHYEPTTPEGREIISHGNTCKEYKGYRNACNEVVECTLMTIGLVSLVMYIGKYHIVKKETK